MQCTKCPEQDETKFYKNSKTLCRICYKAKVLNRYYSLSTDKKVLYQENVRRWQHTNIFRNRFLQARSRAAKRNIEFSITVETLETLYQKQNGKCFFSGMALGLTQDRKYVLSVDRLNSSMGYTPDNVVLVCAAINTMKSDLSVDEFIDIVKNVYVNYQ